MIQILVVILVIALIVRLCTYVFHRFTGSRLKGKRFKAAAEKGYIDPELVAEAKRRETDEKIRAAKKLDLTKEQKKAIKQAEVKERNDYLKDFHVGVYQLIYIFLIASVLGLIMEEVWMYVNFGIKESRVGLVWGPFSPLYGVGAMLLTVVLWRLRDRPGWQIYLLSALLGTALEQLTGMGMEYIAHATSWDYSALPDHITQWTAWRFVIIWGFLGLLWVRVILPEMLYRIGRGKGNRARIIIASALLVFIIFDAVVTVTCFTRNTERAEGIPPANGFEQWIDTHYDSEFISERFENLTVEE